MANHNRSTQVIPQQVTRHMPNLATLSKAFFLFILLSGQSHADDLLTRITLRLAKSEITHGSFLQEKQLKILRKPLISNGTFTYHQSKGVIWKTLAPVTSLLLVNDTHLFTGQGEQKVPPAFGKVFQTILGADLTQLSEGFVIIGEDKKPAWQLQLIPKDDLVKKLISTIQLSGDNELQFLEIQETNGNITHISFDQITHPASLTPEQEADFAHLSP